MIEDKIKAIDQEFQDYEVQMDILGSEYVSDFYGDKLGVYEIVEELAERKERIARLTRTVAELTAKLVPTPDVWEQVYEGKFIS